VELAELLAKRRMVRSFNGTPVDQTWLDHTCATALWAPTAGNSAGVRFSTISSTDVASFFLVATDEEWRRTSRRYEGLARAGAVVLVSVRVNDYLERYRESDKRGANLFERDAWPLPYWHADAAMATMALLLLLEEAGLKATIWGRFRHHDEILRWAGIHDEELFCSVLVGYADGQDTTSASLRRSVPSRHERVRRVRPPAP